MARSLNMALLAAVLVAALIQNSAAQTLHTVGNSMGWVIPSSGAITYTVWAANQNFTVGDTLVFNFASGNHDVAKVTKADYDACTTSNPILLENNSPANIKLNAPGEHYFICNYTGHCSAGQKLAINVSAAVTTSPSPSPSTQPSTAPSPAPQAGTSTPVSAPLSSPVSSPTPSSTSTPTSALSPSLSSSPVTYRVGDSMNWTVPANTTYYQTWAANKSFKVGDVLVFNYASGRHDVAEVTKEAYESCNATSATTRSVYTNPPTAITLNTSGEHFFICRFPQHCPLGQKLAINVTGTAAATAPSPSPSPSGPPSSPPTTSTATPPSSSSATPPSSSTAPSTLAPSGGSSAPPPSSATSLGVAGVSATLVSILVALFLC